MPGSLPTIARREPTRRLNSVDLPTSGRPTMASRGTFASWRVGACPDLSEKTRASPLELDFAIVTFSLSCCLAPARSAQEQTDRLPGRAVARRCLSHGTAAAATRAGRPGAYVAV